MRDKIAAFLAVALLAGAYYLPGLRSSGPYPADLRDAPNSGQAFNALPGSSASGNTAVPPPAAPQSNETNYCGPDVSVPLGNVLQKIENAYNSWTPEQKEDRCLAMDVNTKHPAIDAWDIEDLRSDLGYSSSISKELKKNGACQHTVAVDGKCFRAEEVNYVMWGAMTRLCGKSLRWSSAKVRAYLFYYYTPLSRDHRGKKDSAYKAEAYNKVAWTKAGYAGWPKNWSPYATRPECAISPQFVNSVSFGAHWADVDIK
ncbi:MAG: hypothetical protein NTY45_04820 [Elusimicrobia bacterium]|nr:hypothetical protein [Elusimicrobiota bacterium]